MNDAERIIFQGRRAEIQKDIDLATQQVAMWSCKLEDSMYLADKYDAKLAPPAPVPTSVTPMTLVPPAVNS